MWNEVTRVIMKTKLKIKFDANNTGSSKRACASTDFQFSLFLSLYRQWRFNL